MELNELPGSELILPGLADLDRGKNDSIGSLLISIASIRLTAAGLDIPNQDLASEPELAMLVFSAIEMMRMLITMLY
jgi:hypothetical protein